MRIVILGLSITSSWGNGHATTYRGLVRELDRLGHEVLFLEREQPWYARHRDASKLDFCRIELYENLPDLKKRFSQSVEEAHCVIVGSYVPEGIAVGKWVIRTAQGTVAFYDIDTPVTLAAIRAGKCDYLSPELIAKYPLYLSFSGGPVLDILNAEYGAPSPQAFYCSADPTAYYPEKLKKRWSLGYLGTYSVDRQPRVDRLLLEPARRINRSSFVVAGPQYPSSVVWPSNVRRIQHLSPTDHRAFYSSQRFTLNVTRDDMIEAGYSPSVRLFEAAACGVPIISDRWEGLDRFFTIGREILVADTSREVVSMLQDLGEAERAEIGARARERVLREHTAAHRAMELEQLVGAPQRKARKLKQPSCL